MGASLVCMKHSRAVRLPEGGDQGGGCGSKSRASKGKVLQGLEDHSEDLAVALGETGNPWRVVSTGLT